MPLLDNELARRERNDLLLRGGAVRVKWEFAALPTADGHELSCTWECSARALPDPAERQMLEEVLLRGRRVLTSDDVAAHLAPALRSAAGAFARGRDVTAILDDASAPQALTASLKSAGEAVAFACGLELLPPFQAHLQSPTLERQRLREVQQQRAERQAAGQVEHFHRATELLKQFQSLRAAAPELSPGRVLQQISPADRGQVLQTLLLASARGRAGTAAWAVAGPYLVRIDPESGEGAKLTARPQLIPLPPTLGPLRSVRPAEMDGRRVLLVGARDGFMVIDREDPADVRTYHDPELKTDHGFNAVAWLPRRRQFFATHADGGVVRWDADAPDAPAASQRTVQIVPAAAHAPPAPPSLVSYGASIRAGGGSPGPRNLVPLGDVVLFSIGTQAFVFEDAAGRPLEDEYPSEIVAILPTDTQVWLVHQDGTVTSLDAATRRVVGRDRRSGRVRAAGTLPWLGGARLLLAGDEGPVQCVGFDDPLVTQYVSPYRGLRALSASEELVVAVSPDRQRLVFWNTWDGRQPAGEIFLTALTRHRIADVAVG